MSHVSKRFLVLTLIYIITRHFDVISSVGVIHMCDVSAWLIHMCDISVLQCVAVCCSVLQCAAVCLSALQ